MDPRILDLGVLDSHTEVRSRNFADEILAEVVSQDNRVLARHEHDSGSIDAVRVEFSCSEGPMDFPIDQFDDSHVTYINAVRLHPSSVHCDVLSFGLPVPRDSPLLPATVSNAVI